MEEPSKKLLQWHGAFYAGIRIEMEKEMKNFFAENEHMLATKPMQIDVLIIKKNPGQKVRKNIGQIFRKYNIIEYKSPEDYLSINDFYKVLGYAYFYMADTDKVDEIKTEEITISFFCYKYPQKLVSHLLEKNNCSIIKKEEGIYYILGNAFPVQLVIIPKLSEVKNLWLKNLNSEIKEFSTIEKLIRSYEKNRENALYASVMDIIIRANAKRFGEVINMCEALKELFKDELEEKWKEGWNAGISQGINQGLNLNLESLVRKKILKNKTLEQIASELESEVEEILPIYNKAKEAVLQSV